MLYISCRWSQKLGRAQRLRFGRGDHQRHSPTAPRQVAGLSSVVGRCVFGIVNRPLVLSPIYTIKTLRHAMRQALRHGKPLSQAVATAHRKSCARFYFCDSHRATRATTSYFHDSLLRFSGNQREFRSGKSRRNEVEDGDMSK